jgi:anaerobic selenocysteine-containing dehydrogenase
MNEHPPEGAAAKPLREATSYCRVCNASCGVRLRIDDDDRIVHIRGDDENPHSRGYICFKGLQAEEAHHGPQRLLHPLKREADGSFRRIALEQALDEVAERLGAIIERYGPEGIATYTGSNNLFTSSAHTMHDSFQKALGSSHHYSNMTIDQSNKLISFERMGGWAAGTDDLTQSDVLLLIGTNPLISHSTMGALLTDPLRRLKKAKARGLKLICIDPRRTETARHADLFLQPLPGQDVAILAAIIRVILREGWHDREFCAAHVGEAGLLQLCAAVEPFDEELAEKRAGLNPGEIQAAAEMFARDGKRGAAFTATGASMARFSNTAQHLIDCLNVICNRFRRAGDPVPVDMLSPPSVVRAEVIPPARSWADRPAGRIRGIASLWGEKLTSTLPDEILTPGEGQIHALIVGGGNPAAAIPDRERTIEAFGSLDLLITIDVAMTDTARLAHYIFPPKMMYERADIPISYKGFPIYADSWSQYAAPIVKPPAGSEVVDDWYIYWSIAQRLGLRLIYDDKVALDAAEPPTTEELLEIRLRGCRTSLEELKKYPSGKIFESPAFRVEPATPGANALFDIMPEDVAKECREYLKSRSGLGLAGEDGQERTHLLATRRMRDVCNTVGTNMPSVLRRTPYNPAYLNPQDLDIIGVQAGDRIEITSEHGHIEAVAQSDDRLRPGVLSIAHCWGSLPGLDTGPGVSVQSLISIRTDVEPINAMPRMSAIPVSIRPIRADP